MRRGAWSRWAGDAIWGTLVRGVNSGSFSVCALSFFFFFQAEDGIRDKLVTGVQTCALPISTSPVPAFRLGERTAEPLQMYLADIYTVTGSLAGVPGISVPCGKTPAGLPVGLQILGPRFGEARVLQIAQAFEKAGGYTI